MKENELIENAKHKIKLMIDTWDQSTGIPDDHLRLALDKIDSFVVNCDSHVKMYNCKK